MDINKSIENEGTPGIVMSMYTLMRNNSLPSMHEVEVAFQGNLCRWDVYDQPVIFFPWFYEPPIFIVVPGIDQFWRDTKPWPKKVLQVGVAENCKTVVVACKTALKKMGLAPMEEMQKKSMDFSIQILSKSTIPRRNSSFRQSCRYILS